jgi:hypothetical protein
MFFILFEITRFPFQQKLFTFYYIQIRLQFREIEMNLTELQGGILVKTNLGIAHTLPDSTSGRKPDKNDAVGW